MAPRATRSCCCGKPASASAWVCGPSRPTAPARQTRFPCATIESLARRRPAYRGGAMKANELPPPAQMILLLGGFRISQALYAAAVLGVADQLLAGPEP